MTPFDAALAAVAKRGCLVSNLWQPDDRVWRASLWRPNEGGKSSEGFAWGAGQTPADALNAALAAVPAVPAPVVTNGVFD